MLKIRTEKCWTIEEKEEEGIDERVELVRRKMKRGCKEEGQDILSSCRSFDSLFRSRNQ